MAEARSRLASGGFNLETLRGLTSPRALVIRAGERRRIAGREVVRGDLIVLSEGGRVPADARLLTVGLCFLGLVGRADPLRAVRPRALLHAALSNGRHP